jgi:hypothetical protein
MDMPLVKGGRDGEPILLKRLDNYDKRVKV